MEKDRKVNILRALDELSNAIDKRIEEIYQEYKKSNVIDEKLENMYRNYVKNKRNQEETHV